MTDPSRSWIARRLSELLPAGGLGRAVSVIAGGAAVAQGIVAVSSIVITRLYSPAHFGLYGVATSLVSLVVTFGCLRYEVAIPLPRDPGRAANLVALAILASAAVTALCGVVLLLAGRPIFRVLHAEGLMPYEWLLLLGAFGGGIYLALTNLAIRHRHFATIAQTRVTQSVATVTTQIGLGIASASPGGLIAGDAIGRVAGSGRLGRQAWHTSKEAFERVSLSGIRSAAWRYRSFAVLSSPAALLNEIGLQAPLLLVVALYGATTGGLFALAQRLVQAPLWLLTTAIAQVFVAEAAVRAREDPASLRPLFSRTLRRLMKIGGPMVIVLAIAAPLLVGPVFGSRWEDAGVYVAILAPFYLLQLATSPLGGTLDVLERQDLHLIREIVRVLLISGAMVASSLFSLSSTEAIAALSGAGSLAYVLYGLISWYAITRGPRVRPGV
jgi:O-antigen/teichoic acid export membrane protein